MSSKPNKYKKQNLAASQLFIANAWSLFPSAKLKLDLAKKDVGMTHMDYGTHKFTLKFDEWSEKEFLEQQKSIVGARVGAVVCGVRMPILRDFMTGQCANFHLKINNSSAPFNKVCRGTSPSFGIAFPSTST